MRKIKRFLYNQKLYRSQPWHRGHEVGYQLALSHYPREQAWIKRLETYYYIHINDCQKKKCKCLDKE